MPDVDRRVVCLVIYQKHQLADRGSPALRVLCAVNHSIRFLSVFEFFLTTKTDRLHKVLEGNARHCRRSPC